MKLYNDKDVLKIKQNSISEYKYELIRSNGRSKNHLSQSLGIEAYVL